VVEQAVVKKTAARTINAFFIVKNIFCSDSKFRHHWLTSKIYANEPIYSIYRQ